MKGLCMQPVASKPVYVYTRYPDHTEVTTAKDRPTAYQIREKNIVDKGARDVKLSSSPPTQNFMDQDSVYLSESKLPRPVRKGSRD